jgi:hypothetical protein
VGYLNCKQLFRKQTNSHSVPVAQQELIQILVEEGAALGETFQERLVTVQERGSVEWL